MTISIAVEISPEEALNHSHLSVFTLGGPWGRIIYLGVGIFLEVNHSSHIL